jgi:hypothetical protein
MAVRMGAETEVERPVLVLAKLYKAYTGLH